MNQKQYKKRSWLPVTAVGLSMMAFIMIKSARDAVFFQEDGIFQLPLAYIWISVAAMPAGIIHLNLIDRFGARKSRIIVTFFSALLFFSFFPFVDAERRTLMTILFVIIPTIFAALFAGAWLLAGDLLEGANQKTLGSAYSRIGAGSMIGGILGGLISRGLSDYISVKYIVLLGSVILLLVGIFLSWVHKKYPVRGEQIVQKSKPPQETASSAQSIFSFIWKDGSILREPYVLVLIGIAAFASLAGLLIDFQFYAKTMLTENNNVQFFASFYVILNALALIFQIFIAPRLQSKLGIAGAMLLLPTALMGVSGLFSFWIIAQSRAIVKVTEGGIKSSVHRAVWEQVYLAIDRNRRAGVKAFVDGMVSRLGEGVGAILLFGWLLFIPQQMQNLSLNWISWLIIATIFFWILLTLYLKTLGCDDIESEEPQIRLPDS